MTVLTGEHEVLDQERERECREREIDVTETEAQRRDEHPDRDRDQRADDHGEPDGPTRGRARAGRPRTHRSPANVAWHSESIPPSPVTSVNVRNSTASATP